MYQKQNPHKGKKKKMLANIQKLQFRTEKMQRKSMS